MADAIDRGRKSFRRQAWRDAFVQLSAADQREPLELEDLERLAVAAYLIGIDGDSAAIWERAHQECLRVVDPTGAARCAFCLGFGLLLRGEMARGGGWLARAKRLLEDGRLDCPERGYPLVPVALQSLGGGDSTTAYAIFGQAAEIGDRFGDTAGPGSGVDRARGDCERAWRCRTRSWSPSRPARSLPVVAGIVYCAVIAACLDVPLLYRSGTWHSLFGGPQR